MTHVKLFFFLFLNSSHCQGHQRPSICGRMPQTGRCWTDNKVSNNILSSPEFLSSVWSITQLLGLFKFSWHYLFVHCQMLWDLMVAYLLLYSEDWRIFVKQKLIHCKHSCIFVSWPKGQLGLQLWRTLGSHETDRSGESNVMGQNSNSTHVDHYAKVHKAWLQLLIGVCDLELKGDSTDSTLENLFPGGK